ncbi:unnamed protein product, partial [marine sediment metagenome]
SIPVGKKVFTYYDEEDMSPAVVTMGGNTQAGDVVMFNDNDVRVPAISKDMFIQWRDIQASREDAPNLLDRYALNAAKKVAEEEDKIMITGEYTGFGCYNIQGLATKTGRLPITGGSWPTNAQRDINLGRAALEAAGFYDEPILISRPTIAKYLDTFVTGTATTFRQAFLAEDGILADIMETTSLFTAAGLTNNALLVVPDPAYLYYVEGQPPTTTWWYDKDGNAHGKVREVIAPVIAHAECVCEITGILPG